MTMVEQTFADLWATGTSPGSHPIGHLRETLDELDYTRIGDLDTLADRRLVRIAGVITHRQRPPTAGGVTFLSAEDETGIANVVCSATVWEKYRKIGLTHGALRITGHVERSDHGGGAINIVAGRLAPLRVPAQPGHIRGRDFR
jgi:error-prone DNA polymerase